MADNLAENTPDNAVIDNRYRVVRKIADGGMATVYQTVDERLGRNVAVKIMHLQLAQGPHREQFIERFRREAKSAAAIANPHVVQVYDTGETNGSYYLVMEYVHGVNLRSEIQTHTTFSVRDTLRIIGETLNGLAAAHEIGVVHRDIKPENILINDRGHVEITDFGLAKAASQATLSSTGMLLGTAAYLAPEMIESNLATPQGDCYSVGIMAWELLAGRVPFESDNPVTMVFKHVNENVPSIGTVCYGIGPRVSAFISYLTARDVDQRPKNAQEALQRLRDLMPTLSREALDYQYHPEAPKINSTRVFPLGANAPAPPAPPTPPSSSSQQETVAVAPTSSSADSSTPADQTTHAEEEATVTVPPFLRELADANASNVSGDGTGTPNVPAGPLPASPNDQPTVAQPKRKRKTWLIVTLIVIGVLAIGSGSFAAWYFVGPGSYWTLPKPDSLQCQENTACKITHVSWSDYKRTLDVSNIPYEEKQAYSDTVPSGNIISTDPQYVDAHLSKRNDAKLTVTVSKGVQQATIPENIASESDPLTVLRNAGFTNIKHDTNADEYSEDVPEGQILSISPDPGTTTNHNTEVTVTLSKGPMPVSMPTLAGVTKDQAAKTLADNKLQATYKEEYSDTVPSGTVISATPDAGTELHWGDSVTVTVSKGPQMVTVPDVTGKKTDEAKKILEDLGFEVKVSSPLGDLLHTVRMQSPSGGKQVRVRGEDGKPTVITLTVI